MIGKTRDARVDRGVQVAIGGIGNGLTTMIVSVSVIGTRIVNEIDTTVETEIGIGTGTGTAIEIETETEIGATETDLVIGKATATRTRTRDADEIGACLCGGKDGAQGRDLGLGLGRGIDGREVGVVRARAGLDWTGIGGESLYPDDWYCF